DALPIYYRDQRGRDLDLVELLEMPLDLARRHAARVEREHLLIEARETTPALREQSGFEAALAISGHRDLDLRGVRLHPLGHAAIARVLAIAPFGGVLLVAEVRRHLPFQRTLHQPLRQLRQQHLFPEDLLRLLAFQQTVQVLVDSRFRLLRHGASQQRFSTMAIDTDIWTVPSLS